MKIQIGPTRAGMGIALSAVVCIAVITAVTSSAQEPPERSEQGDDAGGSVPMAPNIVQEWLESRPELEKDDTACVMCAGFGGAVVCGLGCDATGLTIRKPHGYQNTWCGQCTNGEWIK